MVQVPVLRRWSVLALGLLLAVGLALRLWGIHWGLPSVDRFTPLYIDEYSVFHFLSVMDPAHFNFDPHNFIDPPFFFYQVGVVLKLLSILHVITISANQAFYLAHPDVYGQLYMAGRYLVTAYGLLSIVLLFLMGRRIMHSTGGGFLSALFYTLVPLAVLSSKIVEVGVPVGFWLGLTFFLMLYALDESKRSVFFVACLIAGLSFSTKYTSAPMVFPVLYTIWRMKLGVSGVLFAALLGVGGFLIGNPYAVIDRSTFFSDFINAFHQAGDPGAKTDLFQFVQPVAQYVYAIGAPLLVLAVIGLGMGLYRRMNAAWIAVLFLVPYFVILGKSGMLITRYLNETLPFVLPFAAIPILAVAAHRRWAATLLVLAVLSVVPYTLAIDRMMAHDRDPRDQASDWILAHVPANTQIGLEYQANFMTPAHLYMDYWKGKRYPAESVRLPSYRYSEWNPSLKMWNGPTPEYWVENNLFYSPYGKKSPRIPAALASREALRAGSHPLVHFACDVSIGPFHYDLPANAGWDWIIFFPEITVYQRDSPP